MSEMATSGLRDQDRLDVASNYVIWKARMSCLLDEHFLKIYVDSVVVVLADLDPLKKYKGEMAKTENDPRWSEESCGLSHCWQRDCQGDVGCIVDIVSRIFRATEYVLSAEDEVHAYAEGGTH